MTLERVLKELKNEGIKCLIYTSPTEKLYLSKLFGENELRFIEDVRSAVFTAYGMAKVGHTPIAILIKEAYLPSTYTGLTEAWFQRVPVIIVSYNSINLESSAYLERCLDKSCLINIDNNIENDVRKTVSLHGPSLIKLSESFAEEDIIDYTEIVKLIRDNIGIIDILCYNTSHTNYNVINISANYKYGILSKYIGRLLGGKDGILIIPEEILALDSNIFNFRNFPDTFKLVVKCKDGAYWDKLFTWMSKNGIHIAELRNGCDNKEIIEALNQTPTAVLIK